VSRPLISATASTPSLRMVCNIPSCEANMTSRKCKPPARDTRIPHREIRFPISPRSPDWSNERQRTSRQAERRPRVGAQCQMPQELAMLPPAPLQTGLADNWVPMHCRRRVCRRWTSRRRIYPFEGNCFWSPGRCPPEPVSRTYDGHSGALAEPPYRCHSIFVASPHIISRS